MKKTDSLKKNNGQHFRVTPDKKAALNEDVVAKNMQAVNNKTQQRNLAANSEVIKRKIAAEARKAENELRKAKLDQQNKRHNEQRKAAADQMLKIVEDIKASSVAFDMDKSWFALDSKRFVVDGRDMTELLHKSFKEKYLTNNGMGYYLGNVKLDGRGIFLSNKDLASR
ncbi:hypothetical protein [Sediminibacterium ginsengisoli]|uniref:Uncharacterized protein n=1 Tax=Sediminibacterium ginsengisoli TaxID=413434 RepID=A0A1T4KA52_9BACT|nr:hypothetical protein [Sediminibacterium ginsengisoli]SJZ39193.1 hypothetical protein SAMN04488132_101557 [Sediminibacterium ginsengisoli]